MVKLDSRFKTEKSLTDKILRDREPTDADAESVVNRIEDVLRYTAVLTYDSYSDDGNHICQALVDMGYLHVRQRAGWYETGYKGQNERFEAPGGQRFELQLHTLDSLHACDETRDWYDEQKRLDTSREREWELQQLRNQVFANVPIPPGTPTI